MASGIEPGILKLIKRRGGFGDKTIFSYDTEDAVNAGGSPDGALANVTTDKLEKIPILDSNLTAGDSLHLIFKSTAADGLDVSDCVVRIPYWEDGIRKTLTMTDFAAVDITECPAGGEIEIGTGYTIPADIKRAQVGGGNIVLSIQDDTA